jgi:hypothetical protein
MLGQSPAGLRPKIKRPFSCFSALARVEKGPKQRPRNYSFFSKRRCPRAPSPKSANPNSNDKLGSGTGTLPAITSLPQVAVAHNMPSALFGSVMPKDASLTETTYTGHYNCRPDQPPPDYSTHHRRPPGAPRSAAQSIGEAKKNSGSPYCDSTRSTPPSYSLLYPN